MTHKNPTIKTTRKHLLKGAFRQLSYIKAQVKGKGPLESNIDGLEHLLRAYVETLPPTYRGDNLE